MNSEGGPVSPTAKGTARPALTRRALLTGNLGPRSAAGRAAVAPPADAGTEWASYTCGRSGAEISYPPSWAVDTEANFSLLYPHQSFVLRNAAAPVGSSSDLPDLTSYSPAGVYLWLLHYDEQASPADSAPFRPPASYDELDRRASEFAGFSRYGASFAGSQRPFVLRLWIGRSASASTRSDLNTCLSSLKLL
jgi:hypothetical protein